jgi:Do/DeqQ family serine protease
MKSFPFVLAAVLAASVVPTAHAALPAEVDGQPIPTLAPMLQRVTPGVVNISTRGTVQVQQNPLLNDPLFRRFFGQPPQQQERQVSGLGSGVVVDAENGYILTNNHVIERADEITITLTDGRELAATVVGTDSATDLALFQVEGDGLTAVPMGDSDALLVGDFVVAIGNPFGLGQTVTSGIVSGLSRAPRMRAESYEDFIQTDAAINRGNSGGALVNLRGELVGINSAILSGQSGGNIGIGFAIPVSMARQVIEQLIEHGTVRRGMLGVTIQNLDQELADALEIDEIRGALVTNVVPDSPADKAGVRAGDVIVRVNDRQVGGFNELRNQIGMARIGERVRLEILREGRSRVLTAVIEEATSETVPSEQLHAGLQGAVFSNITESSPLYGRIQGVQVTEVEPGSDAARRGLASGDVIIAVNRQEVQNLDDLRRLATPDQRQLLLHIRRGSGAMFLVIR